MLNDFFAHDNQWHDQKMMMLKTSAMSTTGWSSARVYRKSFFTPLDLITDVNPTNRSLWHKTTNFDFLGEKCKWVGLISKFIIVCVWKLLAFLGFSYILILFSFSFLANTFVRLNQISEFGGVCTWGEAQWWNNSCFGRTPNGSLGGLVLCLSASKFALAMDCLHRVIQSNFS